MERARPTLHRVAQAKLSTRRVNVRSKPNPHGAVRGAHLEYTKYGRSDRWPARLCGKNDLPFEVNSALLVELAKLVKDSGSLPDWKDLESSIETAFKQALADIDAMREREGKALAEDLLQRIDELIHFAKNRDACRRRPENTATHSLNDSNNST